MGKFTTELAKGAVFAASPEYLAHPNRQAGKPYLYAFYVIDIDRGVPLRTFGFDIPPQQIRMEEDGAVDVAAAQDGGYWSDERGQYFKMVTIGGTFGFRPTPSAAGASRDPLGLRASAEQLQRAVSDLRGSDGARSVTLGEKTGNTRYRDLHNIIRYYWDLKRNRDTAGKVIFVWADWKMGEVYIAQPLRFNRDRTAPANRFKISYVLNLRLLEPLNTVVRPDFLWSPNSEAGTVAWLRKIQQVSNVLEAASTLATDTVSAAIDYGGSVAKAIFEPVNAVVNLVRDGVKAAQDVIAFSQDLVRIPLYAFQNVHRAALEASSIITSTGKGFEGIAYEYNKIAREIANAFVGLYVAFETSDVNSTADVVASMYKNWDTDAAVDRNLDPNGALESGDGGSNTSLGSRRIPRGAYNTTVPARSTIKQLAAELLGSAGLWKSIALLNNLVPPYISPRGDGRAVLRPGDTIKIPAQPDSGGDNNMVFSGHTDIMREDAYRYGRDLHMDLDTQDLVVGEKGDLDVVEGLNNLAQAMHIKIMTQPGDLKVHPWFGFAAEPGEGLDIDVLAQYHLELERTILSDTRVDRIRSLSMRVSGDVLAVRADLVPKDKDDNLELTFRSRV